MARTGARNLLRRALAGEASRPRVARSALSRRALMAAGGAAVGTLAAPRAMRAQAGPSVAVIGGGLAGLTAALTLAEAGARPVVYEARRRVGGRVDTRRPAFAPALALDLGGAVVNADHAETLLWATSFGLRLLDIRAGRDPALPVDAFWLGGSWATEADLAADLAPLAEAVDRDARALDADWKGQAPVHDALSVADYLQRIDPPLAPAATTLVRLALRCACGVEPEAASALELIWMAPRVHGDRVALLGDSDRAYRIEGGAGTLPQAMAEELGDAVRLGSPVVALGLAPDDRVRVGRADGSDALHDAAVVALPLPALARLTLDLDLPAGFRAMLAQGRLGRAEKVIRVIEGRPWRTAGRFSGQMWTDAGFCAVADASLGQAEPVAALAGLQGGDEAASGDGAALAALLGEAVPEAAAAMRAGALVSDWAGDPFAGGSYTSFAPGAYTRFADWLWWEHGLRFAGPAFGRIAFAGEHLSEAHYGSMEGAVQTGRLAASTVLRA